MAAMFEDADDLPALPRECGSTQLVCRSAGSGIRRSMHYPYLTSFAEAFLHQGADMYGPVPAGAFSSFLQACDERDVEHVRHELERAVRACESDDLDAFARKMSDGWGWTISGGDVIELRAMALAYDPASCEVRSAERARRRRQAALLNEFKAAFPGCGAEPLEEPARMTFIADPGVIDDVASWCSDRDARLYAELFEYRNGSWTLAPGTGAFSSPERSRTEHNVAVADLIRRVAGRAGTPLQARLWLVA